MRLVRLKIDKEVKALLRVRTRSLGIDDPGFTEDVFALLRLRGNGLPSKERISKMAEAASKKRKGVNAMSLTLLMGKRKMTFLSMLRLPYFHALAALNNPIEATERFITKMKMLYYKARAAQCSGCNLLTNCAFGQQYGSVMKDITRVIDADFSKKAHPNCPVLPEISGVNQRYAAMMQAMLMAQANQTPEQEVMKRQGQMPAAMEKLIEAVNNAPDVVPMEDNEVLDLRDPDEDSDSFHLPGDMSIGSGYYDSVHNANRVCEVQERLIEELSVANLALFQLGQKFSHEMTAQKKGKFKPTATVEVDKQQDKMEKVSDITKLTASQHGLPVEIFEHRLEKKTLVKTQHGKQEHKKQLLYLLIDNSASMSSFIGASSRGLYTRGSLAFLFAMAIIRRVRDDGGIVFLRFFSGGPGPLKTAKTPEEFDALLDFVATASFRSGSTDIARVVRQACDDVTAAQDDLSRTEILLITDCENHIDANEVKLTLKKAELNTLDVAGGSINSSSAQALKSISQKFYKANEAAANVSDIVKLV